MHPHYTLARAEKDLFARYQTVYSGADTNLQINWEYRLRDTTWTEDCYWIQRDGARIGGALVLGDTIRFPFLIPPHTCREALWVALRQINRREHLGITKVCGALDADVPILLSHGYAVDHARRCMYRPTDDLAPRLHPEFDFCIPDPQRDIEAMTAVTVAGYQNSIDHQVFGAPEPGEAEKDIRCSLDGYEKTGTLHHSTLVIHRASGRVAGLCLAGAHPEASCPLYSFVADIAVLPEFRGQGLAAFMLCRAVTEAAGAYPLAGLCVTVGNPAESLYRRLGFLGGPRFTGMHSAFGD